MNIRGKRILEWRSMKGWEAVNEFELRNAAEFYGLDPNGKLLPIARAVVKDEFVITRFGGNDHAKNRSATA